MEAQSTKKRILFHCMLGRAAGGSDTCLFLLIKYLDKSKYEPYLLYRDRSILVDQLEDIGIKLISLPKQIKKIYYPTPAKKDTNNNSQTPQKLSPTKLFLRGLINLIKRTPEILWFVIVTIRHQIDIVHTNHYLTGDRLMIIASILLKKKIVSHNRGLYNADLIDRYLSRYVDKIVCMSDFSKSIYLESGISKEKCKTIYDGIDLNNYKISCNHSDPGYENDNIIIGCIGRIEIWKGQQVLVEAASTIIKTVPGVKFLFVGTGDNEDELKIDIRNKGLEKHCVFQDMSQMLKIILKNVL